MKDFFTALGLICLLGFILYLGSKAEKQERQELVTWATARGLTHVTVEISCLDSGPFYYHKGQVVLVLHGYNHDKPVTIWADDEFGWRYYTEDPPGNYTEIR